MPDFVKKDISTGRRLVELNELDVSRDIVEFKFIMKSDTDEKDLEYYLSLTDWTESSLQVFINFTNPMAVSAGISNDAVVVKILNPNLFVSQQSGMALR